MGSEKEEESRKTSRRNFLKYAGAGAVVVAAAAAGVYYAGSQTPSSPTSSTVASSTAASSTAASSTAASSTAASSVSLAGEVIVNQWWSGPEFEPVKKIFDIWNVQHPEIKLTNVTTAYEDFYQQMKVAIVGGNPSDVYLHETGAKLDFICKAQGLRDLTDLWDSHGYDDVFGKPLRSLCSYQGKVYAVPFINMLEGMFYDPKLFTKLGINPPGTWDEFLAVCEKVKSSGTYPLLIGGKDQWPITDLLQIFILRTAGADFYNRLIQGQESWTDSKVVKAMQYFKELFDKQYVLPNSNANDIYLTMAKRHQGLAAMEYQGTWEQGMQANQYSDVFGRDLDMFMFPVIDESIPIANVSLQNIWVTPVGAPHPADAEVFLDWTSHADIEEVYCKASGNIAPSQKVSPDIYAPRLAAIIQEYAKYDLVIELDTGVLPDLNTVIKDQMQKFTNNPNVYQDALAAIQQASQTLSSTTTTA